MIKVLKSVIFGAPPLLLKDYFAKLQPPVRLDSDFEPSDHRLSQEAKSADLFKGKEC